MLSPQDREHFRSSILADLDRWKEGVAENGPTKEIEYLVESVKPFAKVAQAAFEVAGMPIKLTDHLQALEDNKDEAAQLLAELTGSN